MRKSGVLLHISSLPSEYGIGTFGKEAYNFVDFLKNSGQSYWQILPIGPTGYGDSPYQSFSTFAGNPYFIDLDMLCKDGLIQKSDYTELDWGDEKDRVDYEKIFENKFSVLRIAYNNSYEKLKEEINEFRAENSYWIENYAMFMALKREFKLKSYKDWDDDIKLRDTETMNKYYTKLEKDINFYIFNQYMFDKQWKKLKKYANENGIEIIGDIPIYVAEDSADAWAYNEILCLDERRIPTVVAGCPPDLFSDKGQLWGNPVYDWEALERTEYEWWIKRIEKALSLYDVVRIDHFRGFDSYYTIPYGSEDAVIGEWKRGPGMKFFNFLEEKLGGKLPIIAEDLGDLNDDVRKLLKDSRFPGMKVLEFAFDPYSDNEYLPHNFKKNCIGYIGTHDNETAVGWFKSQPSDVVEFAKDYMQIKDDEKEINWRFIRCLFSTAADTVIVQMQDILGLDNSARMNTPSTLGGNWEWRMESGMLSDELCEKLKNVTSVYKRI